MRFSLRWILAGTVYVAIAAAAIATGEWYYADALWTLTAMAFTFAAVLAVYSRGKGKAAAIGFLVLSAVFYGATYTRDNEIGWNLLRAAGLHQIRGQPQQPLTEPPSDDPFDESQPLQSGEADAFERLRVRHHAANAVVTLAFGLMGSLLGLTAFRASAEAKGRETN